MAGVQNIGPAIKKVLVAADNAQDLNDDLYKKDPANGTFEQAGILDGRLIIRDFVDNNEWGPAIEHLLYMIHESEINFPENDLEAIHLIARHHGIRNVYDNPEMIETTS